VAVENAVAADGARVARVQLTLAAAVRPRVRSSRNVIFVEADRLDTDAPAAGTMVLARPDDDHQGHPRAAARGRDGGHAARHRPDRAADVYVPKDGPRRLVMNLANVSSAVASPVIAGQEPVQRVRVGLSPTSPLITEVSMELSRARRIASRLADKNELTVVFDSPLAPAAPVRARRRAGCAGGGAAGRAAPRRHAGSAGGAGSGRQPGSRRAVPQNPRATPAIR
jgi:hypothetical protein